MDSSTTMTLDSKIKLYARIKRSSKYYHQGLDGFNKPRIFQVDEVRNGSHPFRLNENSYRVGDLAFYVEADGKRLIKL